MRKSKDGCTVVQKSVLFYHISQNDTVLEVICESGYGHACGINGINATLSIQTTDTQPGNLCFSNNSCDDSIHSYFDELCVEVFLIMNNFPLK